MTTTTTDAKAFEQAIIAAPHDDLPRLVFADWLDEQGQHDRAEFIRVGCEASRLESVAGGKHVDRPAARPQCVLCDQVSALRRRERELLVKRYGGGDFYVNTAAMSITSEPGVEYVFRRGAVDEVRAELGVLLGGECECVRRWELDRTGSVLPGGCYACSGTGRTPGLGAAVVKAHPVTAIRLTSPRPDQTAYNAWSWSSTGFPPDVWAKLRADGVETLLSEWKVFVGDEARADREMSDMLVAHFRAAAGLPPLPAAASA